MSTPLYLPALQGSFGDWTYYSALVRLGDVVERVGYAAPLHENRSLSEIIQRRLDNKQRARDISDYLTQTADRFFSSLVIGVLGGSPSWHPFSISSRREEHQLGAVIEKDQDLVGYLALRGDENLFALDGQHRLAGIKNALNEDPQLADEKISLLFVPHRDTADGIVRTRRLFISLNKKAVPVGRKDIIILDEVDLAAIITRRLVDSHPWFSRGIVELTRFGNAIPASSTSWTSIGNFYDVNLSVIHSIAADRNAEELRSAAKIRLEEARIDIYQSAIVDFYDRLSKIEPMLARLFENDSSNSIVAEARTGARPRVLARPIGLKIFAKVASFLRKTLPMDATFDELGRIPLLLTKEPFVNVIWDIERQRITSKGESLATRLLCYMLGMTEGDDKLRRSYADHLGVSQTQAQLPRRLRR